MKQYIVKCKGCGKRLRDPGDKLIYVVRSVQKPINKKSDEGEYFCSQRCMDRRDPTRKEAIASMKDVEKDEQQTRLLSLWQRTGCQVSC